MIFVDTSFWVATANLRDGHHDEALRLLERHRLTPLLTTNHVRSETWTMLRRREGHAVAVGFLDSLDRSMRVRLVHVTEELEAAAIEWLRRRDDRNYSFVDATSFVLMRVEGVGSALTFDSDFAAAGFQALRL